MRGRARRSVVQGITRRRHRPDYWLLLLSIILLTVGLVVIYAISPGLSVQKNVGEGYYVGKQLLGIGLGGVVFVLCSQIPLSLWRRWQWVLVGLAGLGSLIALITPLDTVYKAHRWIRFGGLSFQAAELIKFALLIWVAGLLAEAIRSQTLSDWRRTLRPLLIALLIIGVVVAKLQSDLGSTGVMVAMMAVMAYIAGLPLRRVVLIGGIIAIGTILAISTSSYRRDRLLTFLHPTKDCLNTGYQACQALDATGSGGLLGIGLGRSVFAHGYLPETANDSIFAILAEVFGFVGVSVLLGLFVAFFGRLKRIVERAPDDFSRIVAAGILAWLSTQTIINIGAMIGLLPLKGITLPFISYGGTSLLFVLGAVGLAFQISRYTTYVSSSSYDAEGKRHDNSSVRRGFRGAYHPAPGSRLRA